MQENHAKTKPQLISAYVFAQSFYFLNRKFRVSSQSSVVVSDLVGNPEDRLDFNSTINYEVMLSLSVT